MTITNGVARAFWAVRRAMWTAWSWLIACPKCGGWSPLMLIWDEKATCEHCHGTGRRWPSKREVEDLGTMIRKTVIR